VFFEGRGEMKREREEGRRGEKEEEMRDEEREKWRSSSNASHYGFSGAGEHFAPSWAYSSYTLRRPSVSRRIFVVGDVSEQDRMPQFYTITENISRDIKNAGSEELAILESEARSHKALQLSVYRPVPAALSRQKIHPIPRWIGGQRYYPLGLNGDPWKLSYPASNGMHLIGCGTRLLPTTKQFPISNEGRSCSLSLSLSLQMKKKTKQNKNKKKKEKFRNKLQFLFLYPSTFVPHGTIALLLSGET
jgi:hypothetical protein